MKILGAEADAMVATDPAVKAYVVLAPFLLLITEWMNQ